jgi:DNA-binding transcriptional ArsR family regulator
MDDRQGSLFADSSWFHVFKDMIDSGEISQMGTQAFAVYAVIKRYTHHVSGEAFPSIKLIAEKVGIVPRQVMRELKTLEEMGYLTKEKSGRHNTYILREKVTIRDRAGDAYAVASWDYIPQGVAAAVKDLKDVLVVGDFSGAKIVQIKHLTVNIAKDNATQIIFNQQVFEKLPVELQQQMLKMREQIKELSTEEVIHMTDQSGDQ